MTFKYASEMATTTKGMSNKHKVIFHNLNENGIMAKWKLTCDKISKAVEEGLAPSGWIIAYGSCNTFGSNQITALLSYERIPKGKLDNALNWIQNDICRAESKLADLNAGTNEHTLKTFKTRDNNTISLTVDSCGTYTIWTKTKTTPAKPFYSTRNEDKADLSYMSMVTGSRI